MSVLATMNSTPPRPTCTMRLTALLPPPPIPSTLIFAPRRASGSSTSRISMSPSRCVIDRLPSEELLEDAAQPPGHAAERAGADARQLRRAVAVRIEDQPHRRGERRAVDVIGKAPDANGTAAPDRQVEDLLGNLGHPLEDRPAAGQHDAGVERLLVTGAPDLVPDEVEDLLRARLENLREDPPRHQPRLPAADAGDLDRLVLVHHRRERAAVLALHL